MAMQSFPQAAIRPARGLITWALVAVAVAGAVAVVLTHNAAVAVGLAAACVLFLALAARPSILLAVLVASLFVDALNLGGVTISRLVAPVALLVVVAVISQRRVDIALRGPVTWAGLYLGWALTSAFWTKNIGDTVHFLGSLAIALIFGFSFATLVDSERELARSELAIALAAFATGIAAIFAFAGSVGIGIAKSGRTLGGTDDPNLFATYEIMALPLIVVLAANAETPRRRALLYLSGAAVIGAIFTSLSRGGLVALAVVLLILLALPARTFFRSRGQKAVVLGAIAIAGIFGFQASSAELLPRVASLQRGDTSGSGRLYIWHAAAISVHAHPLLGVGYGAFPSVSNDVLVRTPGVDFSQYELRPGGTVAHNLYLGTAADLGLPGLAILLGLLGSTLVALRRAAKTAHAAGETFVRQSANALFGSLIGLAVASLFLSTETSRALWIVIGLGVAVSGIARRRAREAVVARSG